MIVLFCTCINVCAVRIRCDTRQAVLADSTVSILHGPKHVSTYRHQHSPGSHSFHLLCNNGKQPCRRPKRHAVDQTLADHSRLPYQPSKTTRQPELLVLTILLHRPNLLDIMITAGNNARYNACGHHRLFWPNYTADVDTTYLHCTPNTPQTVNSIRMFCTPPCLTPRFLCFSNHRDFS
jgi:hypothetical protein